MSLIRYATRIHFADRVLDDALPEELVARRLVAPLIVADAEAGEALPRLLDTLPAGCRPRVVDLVGEGDAEGAVVAALGAALGPADVCDSVLGLGGPLALDLARVAPPSAGRAIPVMVVPTLPGCVGIGPPETPAARQRPGGPGGCPLPDAVFCDPSLLAFAPPDRLAAAGLDALVHCLEALLSPAWNPPADGMAFDGLRRAGLWLERMVADPHDPEARREVMAAALNGALAAQKGFGAIHAMAHAIEDRPGGDAPAHGALRHGALRHGALRHGALRHGRLHAALAGPALAFNAPAVPDRIAAAAEALRLPRPGDLAGRIETLGQSLGLPVRLGASGIAGPDLGEDGIARIAAAAAETFANRSNPRHATARDYRAMIAAAL